MDWNTVEKRICQDDLNKWDCKAAAADLTISETGRLQVRNGNGGESHDLSDHATAQLCQRLEIPVPYYRRLPGDMKATVANYDLRRFADRSYLLRGKGRMD